MSVNNSDYSLGSSSRGYLKSEKGINKGSVRLLFIIFIYFNFLIYAEAQLVDRVKYYDITGETTDKFVENWHGIQRKQGFAGYCMWQPIMKHGYTQSAWGYRASNLDLKVYVTLTLPRAKYPYDMTYQTRQFYDREIREIWKHEYHHRAYKVQFYNQFIQRFNRLPAMASEEQLYGATNRLLWTLYNDTKAKDAHFDRNGHK